MTDAATGDASSRLRPETRTIDVVPDSERHGTVGSQFTLWFGANTQITTIVDGALAVVFGASALWAIIGLLLGNIAGGAVMALHSAQGPKLGLPQMISSRAQFGVKGAVLPLTLALLMYLGFASTGGVLGGQMVNEVLHYHSKTVGIVIFGAVTCVVAILGYRTIHLCGRIATIAGLIAFVFITVRLLTVYDVEAAVTSKTGFDVTAFLLAVSLSAGWQLTFGPYVADYSRYLPSSIGESKTFWATFLGTVIGTQWSMTIGVVIATVAGKTFMSNQVGFIGALSGPAAVATLIYLIMFVGKVTVNTLNAYGGFMSVMTGISGFTKKNQVSAGARALMILGFVIVAVGIALFASKDFLDFFKNFVLVLLSVFTPWSAINLVDYYLVSHERVNIDALYDPHGPYKAWNWMALSVYALGVVVQLPFFAQKLYTGPITEKLGGADISWIVGLVVTAIVYYILAKKFHYIPARAEALSAEQAVGRHS